MRIIVGVAAAIWLMTIARGVLLPLIVAILIWFVLSAVGAKVLALAPAAWRRRKTSARIVSATGVILVFFVVGLVIRDNVGTLIANVDAYRANFDHWLAEASRLVGTDAKLDFDDLIAELDLRALLLGLAGSGAAYVASLFAVLVYLLFVFGEADALDGKIAALAEDSDDEARLRRSITAIKRSIDDFFAVQVIIGLVQAIPTYLVLALMGVDAPVLWAVLIFLFSFIPTIGTLFGIVFPVLMTLLQFQTLAPVLVVAVVLGVVQVVSTNLILPKLMSRSLNLSPLVVLFAVFAGAAVWGIVGALIAVPALTIALIVCMENPKLRPVAVLLSARGTLPAAPEPSVGDLRESAGDADPAADPR